MVLLDVIGLCGSRMLICRFVHVVEQLSTAIWRFYTQGGSIFEIEFLLRFPLPRIFPLFETQHTSWPSKNSTKCSRKQRVPGVVTIVRLYHSYSTCRGDRTGPSGHPLFSRRNNSVINVFHSLRSNFLLFLVYLNLLYDTFNDRAILFLYVKSYNIFPGWPHADEEKIIVIENEDGGTCHEAYSIRSGLMQICSIDIKLHPSRPDWVRM